MRLHYVETPETIRAILPGDSDWSRSELHGDRDEVRGELWKLYDRAAAAGKRFILNLSLLEFLPSLMLAEFLRMHKRAQTMAVDLRFTLARPDVMDLLRITQLDKVLRFEDDHGGPDLFGAAVPRPKPPGTDSGHVER